MEDGSARRRWRLAWKPWLSQPDILCLGEMGRNTTVASAITTRFTRALRIGSDAGTGADDAG